MKTLTIEWKHFEKEGETCSRCNITGINLRQVIEELQGTLLGVSVTIELHETTLPEDQMDISNIILFNGVPIETLLDDVTVVKNCCDSCGDLIDSSCNCRAVQTSTDTHDEIPKSMIKEAILKSIKK